MSRLIQAFVIFAWCTSAAAGADLEVRDIQASYGLVAPKRQSLEYHLPKDHVYFRFSVVGAKLTDNRIDLDVTAKLVDKAGKTVLSRTTPVKGTAALAGDSFGAFAYLPVLPDMQPGNYTFRVTVKDNTTTKASKFEREVRIEPRKFSIKAVAFFYDRAKRVRAGSVLQVGERLHFAVQVVGLDGNLAEQEVTQRFEVIDAKTKKVCRKLENTAKQAGRGPDPSWNMFGDSGILHRPGLFILRFTIIDRAINRSVQFETPIRVLPAPALPSAP